MKQNIYIKDYSSLLALHIEDDRLMVWHKSPNGEYLRDFVAIDESANEIIISIANYGAEVI